MGASGSAPFSSCSARARSLISFPVHMANLTNLSAGDPAYADVSADGVFGWASRAPLLIYPEESRPLLIWCIVQGLLLFAHSAFFHRGFGKGTWNRVRVVADLASLGLMAEASTFLYCAAETGAVGVGGGHCSTLQAAGIVQVVGCSIFGMLVQTCDNYITFERYQIVCDRGNSSKLHKVTAFLYYFILLDLTWWPFSWFWNIWFDMGSDTWIEAQGIFAAWLNFASYVVFNLFYLSRVGFTIHTLNKVADGGNKKELIFQAKCAFAQNVFSIAGIVFYSTAFIEATLWVQGVIMQNVCLSLGCHLCINVQFKFSKPENFKSSSSSSSSPPETTRRLRRKPH